ncbi:AAA family ATPase [Vibrio fluvialis]|nr:AAA family ATPase [Vibrio fluvialis]
MKFTVKKLGKIDEAEIELKNLTIFCGPNSSNKTWLSYLICNLLDCNYSLALTNNEGKYSEFAESLANTFQEHGRAEVKISKVREEFKTRLEYALEESKQRLHQYFNVEKSALSDFKLNLDLTSISTSTIFKKPWTSSRGIHFELSDKNMTMSKSDNYVPLEEPEQEKHSILISFYVHISSLFNEFRYDKPYLATSERTGALVFQNDLDRTSVALDSILSSINEFDMPLKEKSSLIQKVASKVYTINSRLSSPVRNNISDIRNSESYMKELGFIGRNHPEVLSVLDELNGGKFIFDKDDIRYIQSSLSTNSNGHKIGSASSSIKSLYLIDLYVRYKISISDILLIDEPELNLHPNNQRLMAKLIARLVNAGVKVVITTHSDYLIREISSYIALSNDFSGKEELMDKYNLIDSDILNIDQVAAYSIDPKGKVNTMSISSLGIETKIFDKLIDSANDLQDQILYRVAPELFEQE